MVEAETSSRPYVSGGEAFSEQWTNKAYRLQQDEKIVATIAVRAGVLTESVSGPCPRCDHSFSSVKVASGPVVKGSALPGAGEWSLVLVRCECQESHDGRPAGQASGCGARYNMYAQEVTA